MTKRTCSVDGCDRPHFARNYCNSHYSRVKSGKPAGGPIRRRFDSHAEALDAYSTRNGDCIEWTGATAGGGYGVISARGEKKFAHRVAWERVNGPVPDGHEVDHICRNTSCVNPVHLRVATHKQNTENRGAYRNSKSGIRGVSWNKARGKWQVTIRHNYKKYYGGLFESIEDAERAAIELRNRLFTFNIEKDAA